MVMLLLWGFPDLSDDWEAALTGLSYLSQCPNAGEGPAAATGRSPACSEPVLGWEEETRAPGSAGQAAAETCGAPHQGEFLGHVWKSPCFFLPGAALPISSFFTSITDATKLFWGLCIMGAVGDMKPVFRTSLEWKYQCLLKHCLCSPQLGSCCAEDTWLCLRLGIDVRAENWIMLLLECFEPLKGIYNGFGCTASFPKENKVAAPCQLFLWKNNLQRVRDLPSSYAGSLFKCNGKH